jgi:alkylated DNA nucleotide flippase Atl1
VATRTTTEQKDLLSAIELQAASLEMHQRQVDDTRRHLWELMEQAKDAKVSSYSIAKAAGLSQPRVMQIIKGITSPSPKKKSPTKKELVNQALVSQIAALQEELQQARDQLQNQGIRDAEQQPEPELQSTAHGEP